MEGRPVSLSSPPAAPTPHRRRADSGSGDREVTEAQVHYLHLTLLQLTNHSTLHSAKQSVPSSSAASDSRPGSSTCHSRS